MGPDDFAAAVVQAKHHILDGDIFQVVLSLRWSLSGTPDCLELYHRLAAANPSPFQYCYRGPSLAVVGASPEPLVTLTGDTASIRPLAGTRRRGADQEEDLRLEQSLRSSIKEVAEHRMLVDLARNDLGRVCRPGTVTVDELLAVERYSHVMHLVSNVVGKPAPGVRADQVLRAGFPAGTMTGTPKVRAMEIIDQLEPVARGFYSGGVGLLSTEELHTFLTIRSLVMYGGMVHLQAGAGIVYDSDPEEEYAECLSKLGGALAAAGYAHPLEAGTGSGR
jgi:anthranilate synthase component I